MGTPMKSPKNLPEILSQPGQKWSAEERLVVLGEVSSYLHKWAAKQCHPNDPGVDPGDIVQDFLTGKQYEYVIGSFDPNIGEFWLRIWFYFKRFYTWESRKIRHSNGWRSDIELDLIDTAGLNPNSESDALADCVLLEEALATLKPEQQEVIELHYIQGLSLKEIAERTNHTEGKWKTTLFRARFALRKFIIQG